jgi:hypothetical protein
MKRSRALAALFLATLLAGCAGLEPLLCWPGCNHRGRQSHGSSSLVGFLYPEGTDAVPANALPTLPVPLRVGLSFLPDRDGAPVEGLAGVQRLYGVDLMALVSYDQVRYQDDRGLAAGYLTVVGAYVLKGTRQDVTTLMDMAVIEPATRSIVLRAGGTGALDGPGVVLLGVLVLLVIRRRPGPIRPGFIAMTATFMQDSRPLEPAQRVHAERRCHSDGR